MKKRTYYVNTGVFEERELTSSELAAMQAEAERMAEEMKNLPPSMEERMEAIESAFLALLGGGL